MSVPGMTPNIESVLIDALEDAYAAAFAFVYYAAVAVGATAVIAALFIKDYDQFLTGHVPRQVYKKREQEKVLEVDGPVHLEDVGTAKSEATSV
jgi:nicotinamide riboside kinase